MTEKPSWDEVRDPHALAIGKIAMAWNEYHALLGEIFALLFGTKNWALAFNAWHAIPSDKSQRDMLRAVAQTKLKAESRELEEVLWLLDKTNDVVSAQRNIGIHTTLWSLIEHDGTHRMVPVPTNARAAKALADTQVLKEYQHYEKQIRKMVSFAVGIQFVLSPRRRSAKQWPDRPVLSKRSPP